MNTMQPAVASPPVRARARTVRRARLGATLLLCAGALLALSAQAADERPAAEEPFADEPFGDERLRFVAAREALAAGDRERFLELEQSLRDYPLHPWLVHERLLDRWREGEPTLADLRAVEAFETATADTALARRLVRALQARLAATERWKDFLAVADSPHAASMPCRTLRAREATDPPDAFDKSTLALWTAPTRRDAACTAALEALERRAPTPPVEAVWERIYRAMEADRPAAAEAALGYLAAPDRRRVEGWIGALDKPVQYLASGAVDADTAFNRRVIADLVMRWSREDTAAAMRFWQGARSRFSFDQARRYDTDRALAMRAAYRRMPEAQAWLDAFEAREDDLELKEWRIRTALLAGDWVQVVRGIHRLPPAEREEDHWAYWEARALETAGHRPQAEAIYTRLAALQSWHGFLSAERVGLPHAIEDEPIVPAPGLLERLAVEPALVRAREYHRVALANEGRREWSAWIAERPRDELAASAVLAARWGLGDRAIFSAGRADAKRALTLRFPLLYGEQIAAGAAEHDLERAWVHGLVRRESAYIPDIRSPAGALGLMQMMPATAKDVARWRGEKGWKNWKGDLTDPVTNVAFGTFYLRRVLDRFDGHPVLATAAYNAGPHRVAQWLPETAPMEADRWIDTIPFTETRRYVRAVLAYAAIYERELSGEAFELLGERLRPVPPAAEARSEADEAGGGAAGDATSGG